MLRGALFIDGASISRKLQERGKSQGTSFKLEYGKLARWIENMTQSKLIVRRYYTAKWGENTSRGMFYQHLEERGFEIVEMMSKEFSKYVDHGEGLVEQKVHADKGVDIAIALDAYVTMTQKPDPRFVIGELEFDVLVVATHDGDFVPLLQRLKHKKCYVVGFSDRMSIDLRGSATPLFLDHAEPGVMRS